MELAGELAGRTVLVTGGGPIGQLACRLAYLKSPAQILLMEPAAERAQFAADSHAVSIAAVTADGGAGGLAVDVVLECSGSAAATSSALNLLAPGGILVVVGAGPEPALDSATILLKEITVRGSYIYTDEFDRAIDLLATGLLAVEDLTTVITRLPDALTAFDELRAGRIMKALIAPGTHQTGHRAQSKQCGNERGMLQGRTWATAAPRPAGVEFNGRRCRRRREPNLPNRWEPQTAVLSARGGTPSTESCAG